MQADQGFEVAAARAQRACDEAVAALSSSGIAPEALAEYVPPRRRARIFTRAARMRRLGEVWRLGALLLDVEGRLYAAGRATRAAERGRPGYQSVSREERREIAAAALRGGFAKGSAVNYDAVPIPLESIAPIASGNGSDEPVQHADAELPIGFADGELRVRWRPGASLDGAPTLAAFLRERVELIIDPPFRG